MHKSDWIIALVLFLATLFILCATSNHYGLAWDEPYNYSPAVDAYQWLQLLVSHPTQAISAPAIEQYWTKIHEHPSFSKLIAGITHGWFSGIFGDMLSFRLGEFLLFSLLISLIYLFALQLFNRTTALFSAAAFLLMPRVFGQAHFATTDIPLTLMWFLTVFCFYKGLDNWKWSIATGIVWGLGLSTKINLLFLPIPLILWAQIFYRKKYGNNAFSMLFISPLIFFLSWPWLWFQTKTRIMEYLLFYAQHKFTTVYYFGKMYVLTPAPWHYPLVYTITTIPITILFLILIAIIVIVIEKIPNAKIQMPNPPKGEISPSADKSQNPNAKLKTQFDLKMLILFNALFPILLQSSPASPKYDGIRLFLPAFPYLAIIAGIGFNEILNYAKLRFIWVKNIQPLLRNRIITLIISAILILPPLYHVIVTHPYQLSYHNLLFRGISGAHQQGMESTYWCEAVNQDVLQYLNQLVPENGKVRFLSFSDEVVQWYQEHNYLRKDIQCFSSDQPEYLVLQCRQGFFGGMEWNLYSHAAPIKAFSYRNQVPLVLIYQNPAVQ
jgi:4-amino-4-deoxy-L-arabinose transferase-like glycosyltransferase